MRPAGARVAGAAALILLLVGTALAAGVSPALLTRDGSVLARDGTLVPPYPVPGKWAEGEPRSTDRWEIRTFRYLASPQPPPIELTICLDKLGEPPDGVFETEMVKGYLSGFGTRAGLSVGGAFFVNRTLGPALVRQAKVKMWNDKVTAWAHVTIFVRSPSLVFIAVRPTEEAPEVDRFLASLGIGTR